MDIALSPPIGEGTAQNASNAMVLSCASREHLSALDN